MRQYIVTVYVIAFIIVIVSVLSIPSGAWQLLSFGQSLLIGFDVLVCFCGVMLAYFVYVDGQELDSLRALIRTNYDVAKQHQVYSAALTQAKTKPSSSYVELLEQRRKKGFINPDLKLEEEIREKMANGKTREEAISELYSGNTAKNEV